VGLVGESTTLKVKLWNDRNTTLPKMSTEKDDWDLDRVRAVLGLDMTPARGSLRMIRADVTTKLCDIAEGVKLVLEIWLRGTEDYRMSIKAVGTHSAAHSFEHGFTNFERMLAFIKRKMEDRVERYELVNASVRALFHY
jgi:hypothetical protein